MKIDNDISDELVLKEVGQRIARYRLNRNMTQKTLAYEAGVSLPTMQRLEQGNSVQSVNLIRVLRALDLLANLQGMIPEPAVSPVQLLHLQGRTRQRASKKSSVPKSAEPWSWGDDD